MLSKLLVFVLSSIILQKQRWNVSNATFSTSAYCAVNLTMTSLDRKEDRKTIDLK
jgi:hypothetical protein